MVLARLEGAPSNKAYVLYVVEMARPITQSKIFIWMSIGSKANCLIPFRRELFPIINICSCLWQCFSEKPHSSSELKCPFFKIIRFDLRPVGFQLVELTARRGHRVYSPEGFLNFSYCDLFAICYLLFVF